MLNTAKIRSTERFSPWPYAIVTTFVALAIFDSVIVYLALTNPAHSIEDNSYEVSKQYESVIAARSALHESGITHTITPSPGGITIAASGLNPSHYSAHIKILRADSSTPDILQTVDGTGPDFKYAKLELPSGLWLVTVTIISNGKNFLIGPEKIFVE